MSTQRSSPNQLEEVVQEIPLTGESWIAQEIVVEASSANQSDDINPTVPGGDASMMAFSIVEVNEDPSANQQEKVHQTTLVTEESLMSQEIVDEFPLANQLEQVVQAMPFPQLLMETNYPLSSNQPMESDPTILVPDASWMAHDTLSSNQPLGINQTMLLVSDASWMTHGIVVANQTSTSNRPQEINQTMPVTQASWITQIVAPSSNQPEGTNAIMPVADGEGSWVARTMANTTQGVQWGTVALVYPTQDELNQSQEINSAVPTADPMVVDSAENWEVHPYIRASLDSLNDLQTSGEQPTEYLSDSPGPLAIDEGVQPEYQEDSSTIAVPLVTDPNVTPELVTFRPGVYEGDAIPPVYSNFSIIAASNDYEPQVPSPVYPNLSIIPEPVPEDQIITEPVPPQDAGTTIDEGELSEFVTNAQPIAENNIDECPSIEKTVEQKLPTEISRPSTNSGYRSADAKLLATLRHTKLILIYKGYHFRRYYCQNLKIRWQCVSQRCKAYLYSVGNKITVAHPVHNHLSIIPQTSTSVQSTEPNADCISLEEAISALTDSISSFNDITDPNTSSAADMDTLTLSYDQHSPPNTEEVYNPSQIMAMDGNPFYSNVTHLVLTSGNTIIPHDPSLEITVKSPSAPPENVDVDVNTSITTTLTSVPDPLGICVTTYTPPTPQNKPESKNDPALSISSCSGPAIHPNYNYMTVPEDVPVKVTITSESLIAEPRVYYDGKLATEQTSPSLAIASGTTPNIPTDSNTKAAFTASNFPSRPTFTPEEVFPPAKSYNEITFAQVATNEPAAIASNAASASAHTPYIFRRLNILGPRRDLLASDAATISNVTITRGTPIASAQTSTNASTDTYSTTAAFDVPTGTQSIRGGRPFIKNPHSQYSGLHNSLTPRAQTPAVDQQSSHEKPRVTKNNISLPNIPAATSRASVSLQFRGNFRNPSLSDNLAINTPGQAGSIRIPIRPIPRVSIPPRLSLPRTMILDGYPQRRSINTPGQAGSIRIPIRPIPRVSIPPRLSLPRTMIPDGYPQRRSIRLARARNVQSSSRKQKSDDWK